MQLGWTMCDNGTTKSSWRLIIGHLENIYLMGCIDYIAGGKRFILFCFAMSEHFACGAHHILV